MEENQFTNRRAVVLKCFENREILKNIFIGALNPIKEMTTTEKGHTYEALQGYDAIVYFANTKIQIIVPMEEIETVEFMNKFEDKSGKENILSNYTKLVGSTMDLIVTEIVKNEPNELVVMSSQKKASAKKRAEVKSKANNQDNKLEEAKVILRKGNFAILEKNGYYNPVNLYFAGEPENKAQGVTVGDTVDMMITGYSDEKKIFRGSFEKETMSIAEKLKKYNVTVDSVVSARVVKVYSKTTALVSIHPLQLIAKATIKGNGEVQPDQFCPMLVTSIKNEESGTRIYGNILI